MHWAAGAIGWSVTAGIVRRRLECGSASASVRMLGRVDDPGGACFSTVVWVRTFARCCSLLSFVSRASGDVGDIVEFSRRASLVVSCYA